MVTLIAEVEKYISVNPSLKKDLMEHFTYEKLQKNELWIREGQFNLQLAFIKSGVLRCFNLRNEKDVTNEFFFKNTFVTDYDGLLKNKPAKQSFEAIEPTEIYILSAEKLFSLAEVHPELREWGAKMAEDLFSKYLGKSTLLKSDSPEERYLAMLEEKPMFIKRIPLHYIASYLGITQVHLSRIRKKIS